MSDRLPGTTYDNPIWYRGYRIHLGPAYTRWDQWTYVHDDYDGPEDRRIGLEETEAACREAIDDLEDAQ